MAKKKEGKKKKIEMKKITRGREMSLEGRMLKKSGFFFSLKRMRNACAKIQEAVWPTEKM